MFINTYRHILEEVEDISGRTATDVPTLRFPSNFCCVIYSNLACCCNSKGDYKGWTEEEEAELRALAETMLHFRCPIYVCSAPSRRWNLPESFDYQVQRAQEILAEYPQIGLHR